MWIVLFYSLRLTMFSLPSLLHIHKNYLHAGIQECDMMISPTSLIKHCKIRDYAGPPRVTFQGYHIMCICWVPPLLDPEVRQAYYFTVRGDERHDLPSLLTPMEIRYAMFTLRYPQGIHPYFSPCQEEVDALADRGESQTWCEEWYDTFVRFRFLLPPETRVPFPSSMEYSGILKDH